MPEALQLPVFSVDDWSGNVRDDNHVEWWITGVNGWTGSPPLRLELAPRPQRDGTFDAPSFRAARVVTLDGIAIATDRESTERAKDRLAAVLADGSRLAVLTVQELLVTRMLRVRLSADTKIAEQTPFSFTWSLQLSAPDPVRYSSEEHVDSCGLSVPGEGITFPVTFPLQFGESSGGTLVLTNNGTMVTWPVWTVTGPCVDPVIRNAATGESLRFAVTLFAGDALVVDVGARTIHLNRVSRRQALLPGSTWFGLPPDSTGIEFDAQRTDTLATLSVSWRDAWI